MEGGRRKWINPPLCNWINRRFVARRPASQLLFTTSHPSHPLAAAGAMMYVSRDLYPAARTY